MVQEVWALVAVAGVLAIGLKGRASSQCRARQTLRLLQTWHLEHDQAEDFSEDRAIRDIAEALRQLDTSVLLIVSTSCRQCRELLETIPPASVIPVLTCGSDVSSSHLSDASCRAISLLVTLPALVIYGPGDTTADLVEVNSWEAIVRALQPASQGQLRTMLRE